MDENSRYGQEQPNLAREKKIKRIITVVVLAAAVAAWLLLGGVKLEVGNEALTVGGRLAGSVSVAYAEISSVELRSSMDFGSRSVGVSSLRSQCGTYQNSEFGSYRLYAYGNAGAYIVVRYAGEEVLVFNQKDPEDTRAVYEQLLDLTGLSE